MVTIRNMIEADILSVAELESNIFSDAWTIQGIRDTFEQKQAIVVVAEEKNVVVGYCVLYYVLDEAEIARVAVDEAFRRQGLGFHLLDDVCDFCKENHIERLLLDVRESNKNARAFYEKYGFQADGVRKGFYEQPKEDAVLMSKRLD